MSRHAAPSHRPATKAVPPRGHHRSSAAPGAAARLVRTSALSSGVIPAAGAAPGPRPIAHHTTWSSGVAGMSLGEFAAEVSAALALLRTVVDTIR